MANNTTSNITDRILRRFGMGFESNRVLSKMIDTSDFQGNFTPAAGDRVRAKRPHQYTSVRTAGGDISATTPNDIVSGSFEVRVQDMITVEVPWTVREETLSLDQLQEILDPASEEMVKELELSVGGFMLNHTGLRVGSVGTQPNDWADIAQAGNLMKEIGTPMMDKYYVMNNFVEQNLAGVQQGINNLSSSKVDSAFENSMVTSNFAGMKVMTSNALENYTAGATTDRIGVIGTTPNATYTAAKDSMEQTIQLTGLAANITNAIRPGDQITITQTDRSRINVKNRRVIIDASGNQIPWTFTAVTGGNTDASGNVTITVTNAAINHTTGDAAGQYTNISNPIVSGDAFRIEGNANQLIKPNLFFHKSAFSIASIPLPALHSTDTYIKTKDGLSIRVSQGSEFRENTQSIRFDLFFALGVSNPLFAGHGYG